MKPVDILIVAIIAVLFLLAIRFIIRHRGQQCGGNCTGCPHHDKCKKEKKK